MQKVTSNVLSVKKETFIAMPWESLCNNIHIDRILWIMYGNAERLQKAFWKSR